MSLSHKEYSSSVMISFEDIFKNWSMRIKYKHVNLEITGESFVYVDHFTGSHQ